MVKQGEQNDMIGMLKLIVFYLNIINIMIKNDLEFKIHDDFIDWFDGLKGETSYFQCWMEGFKKGMNFNDNGLPCRFCGGELDKQFICIKCGK